MCLYTNTRYSCGHFHQGTAIGTGSVVCIKCIPVKTALEYWHRQLQYLSIEAPTGHTMSCPRACRQVRPLPRGFSGNRAEWQADDATLLLWTNMLFHGVDAAEASRILTIETTPGLGSIRGPREAYKTSSRLSTKLVQFHTRSGSIPVQTCESSKCKNCKFYKGVRSSNPW